MVRSSLCILFGLLFAATAVAADPTAHGPQYETKAWAGMDDRAAYRTQSWPKARLLVWATPGKGGSFRSAGSWLEGGKRASKGPDRETDILLPASDKPYVVNSRRGDHCRHVTLRRNAGVVAGHAGGPFTAWGNVWVHDGGRVHFIDIVGPGHTFFRLDGGEFGRFRFTPRGLPNPWKDSCSAHIHHKMQVTKFNDGSVEFLGNLAVGDEFYLSRGRMIVSGEFRWSGSAGKGVFEVFDGATLELQAGGAVAPHRPRSAMRLFNLNIYKGGTLRGGSPQRPLTGDAFIRLGTEGGANSGVSGLYMAEGSTLRVHTKDPAKARLALTAVAHAGEPEASGDGQGLDLQFGGDAALKGVLFDYVRVGGIHVLDDAVRKQAADAAFGPHNAGRPEELFSKMTRDPKVYYHPRKYYRFNRVMEGLGQMKKFGEDVDVTYPSSGKVFTHQGKTRYAPGAKKKNK